MRILIETSVDDLHAVVVERALQQRGHDVVRHFGGDFPVEETVSLHFGTDGARHCWAGPGFALDPSSVDVVWWRRPSQPSLPDCVDPLDRAFARQQLRLADDGRLRLLRDAFWINPAQAATAAASKILQLRLAPACGLRVPPTLIGNAPRDVHAFVAANERTIYKPLHGGCWDVDGRRMATYTARVTPSDLPADALLQACPGIYQAQVDKAFEVRAQFYGDTCLAARIDSASLEYGEFDWRKHQSASAFGEQVQLPPAVHAGCRQLMRQLGIVAGAFDFIVTPDQDWVFLEVNESGQFLFLELWCPQLPVVDALCAFIESRDPDFRYQAGQPRSCARALLEGDWHRDTMRTDRRAHRDSVASPPTAERGDRAAAATPGNAHPLSAIRSNHRPQGDYPQQENHA